MKKLKEDFAANALDTNSWPKSELGMEGEGDYTEYTFDIDGLQKLSVATGMDIETLKTMALDGDGFDDESLELAGLPLGDENGEGRYEEFIFDGESFDMEQETDSYDEDEFDEFEAEKDQGFGVIDGYDYEVLDEKKLNIKIGRLIKEGKSDKEIQQILIKESGLFKKKVLK